MVNEPIAAHLPPFRDLDWVAERFHKGRMLLLEPTPSVCRNLVTPKTDIAGGYVRVPRNHAIGHPRNIVELADPQSVSQTTTQEPKVTEDILHRFIEIGSYKLKFNIDCASLGLPLRHRLSGPSRVARLLKRHAGLKIQSKQIFLIRPTIEAGQIVALPHFRPMHLRIGHLGKPDWRGNVKIGVDAPGFVQRR